MIIKSQYRLVQSEDKKSFSGVKGMGRFKVKENFNVMFKELKEFYYGGMQYLGEER